MDDTERGAVVAAMDAGDGQLVDDGGTRPAHRTPMTDLTARERAEREALHAAWWEERKRKAANLVESSKRSWAALQGWQAVTSEEQWLDIQDRAAEDWASGAALIQMLGGERYLDPPRMALLLHLWHHFVVAYRPDGPAEYLCIAMALVAYNQLIRVNEYVGNLQARLEWQFFSLADPIQVSALQKDGYRGTVTTDLKVAGRDLVEELGRDALPLLDRLNRMVIRNLKALRDLKAAPISMTVQNYGQLNVGQAQTNLAQSPKQSTGDS